MFEAFKGLKLGFTESFHEYKFFFEFPFLKWETRTSPEEEAGKVQYLFFPGCQHGPVCFTLNSQEEP